MTYFKNILTSVAGLAILSLAPNAGAVDEIGVNSAIKGDVTIQSGEQSAKQAMLKDPLFLGDQVNSSSISSLQVLLKDQTVFTVGPDCQLTIDKFVYDPNNNSNGLRAKVSKGMFRFMSGNISKSGPDSVTIDTPVASMGVRGTMVEGVVGADAIEYARQAGLIPSGAKVDPAGATLFVLRGPGRRSKSKNRKGEISVTSGGRTVTTRRSGFAIFVGSTDSVPTDPFLLDADVFNAFNRRLRTEPTGGASFKPFELDPFTQEDLDDQLEINDFENPLETFDWPSDEHEDEIITPTEPTQCLPQDPDYPDCFGP